MHSSILSEISVIIAIGAGVALLMKLLRQPLIIGYILTGVIAGPTLFDLIKHPDTVDAIAGIGIALLIFIVGLDLSTKILSRVGKTVLVTTLVQASAMTALGYAVARLLKFEQFESLVIGLALALSSTIVIVKLFNDKKETTRLYAQITIGVLLLQDIVATAAKIGLALKAGDDGTAETIIYLLLRGISLTILVYLASKYLVPLLTRSLESSKELLLVFGLAWGLGLAAFYESIGFSIEIGALFAGISLASLPYSSEMASRLKPLRDFFIVIFFVTLGQDMTPGRFVGVTAISLAFASLVLFIKPLVVMLSLGVQGYTKRASFKAAISMSQVSEFSLVFMASALAAGLVSSRASDMLVLVALITFCISTYFIKYDNWLFDRLEKRLKFFERRVTKYEQTELTHKYSIALFGYRKGGAEYIKTFRTMNKKFVVVDYDPDVIDILEKQNCHYLYGDATDPELLEEMNLDQTKLIVSVVTDHQTNSFLAHWLAKNNPSAVFICSADTTSEAADLYEEGAAYVMMPHYIGSEKISAFIRKNGFNKTEFKNYRDKHLNTLTRRHSDESADSLLS